MSQDTPAPDASEPDVADAALEAYAAALEALGPYAMTVGQLDGLLAAVVLAPNPLEAEVWLGAIWMLEEDDPVPEIDPEAPDVAFAISLILGRGEEIRQTLDDESYAPIFDADRDGSSLWEVWADGFMVGMTLDPDGWEARLEDRSAVGEAAQLMLTLIDISQDDPDTLKRLSPAVVRGFKKDAPDLLTEAALEMWRPAPPSTPIVRGPKIGRNDPCPCGSGKKHKKCCGAA